MVTLDHVRFYSQFNAEGKRSIAHVVERLSTFPAEKDIVTKQAAARISEDDVYTVVRLVDQNTFLTQQKGMEEDSLGNASIKIFRGVIKENLSTFSAFCLSREGNTLFAGAEDGYLMGWDLSNLGSHRSIDKIKAFSENTLITALSFVYGDESVVVGNQKGAITTWSLTPTEWSGNKKRMRQLHAFSSHSAPIIALRPTSRDKSVLSWTNEGSVHLDHMTSEQRLITIENDDLWQKVSLSERGNGLAALDTTGKLMI
ncbi:MAG: hypothetical protein GKR87_14765 [Kiritimatiellae bacterium]|nr:hypothetical protein [Kiritimatiellia bacterium]